MKHRFRFVRDDVCGTIGVRIDKIWKTQNEVKMQLILSIKK